jgi:hypothetical protein
MMYFQPATSEENEYLRNTFISVSISPQQWEGEAIYTWAIYTKVSGPALLGREGYWVRS